MLKIKELYSLFQTDMPTCFNGNENIACINTDTREVNAESVFVALKGERFDGHEFIPLAFQNGAMVVIAERLVPNLDCEKVIIVEDTVSAYQKIATYYREKFSIPVVAVTGSNGKTSTKDMIYDCLQPCFNTLKNYANFNNEIGVPKTLLLLKPEHQVAVIEMGMRGLGQIEELTKIAKPSIAVITNVGLTHIELLGNIDNIASAKAEIFKYFKNDDIVVLNYDNEYTLNMRPSSRCVYFGMSELADIVATNISYGDLGTEFLCRDKIRNNQYLVHIPLVGEHNVYNALAALAVASLLETELEKTLLGLSKTKLSEMRQTTEIYKENILVINDAYNAAPVSMKMSLNSLRDISKTRRSIAVLGDMLELGKISMESHKKLAKDCKTACVDIVLLYGQETKYTLEESVKIGVNAVHFENKKSLASYLKKIMKKHDIVLFKGSRGMGMEEIITEVFH